MATFRREKTGYIYLYHWLKPTPPQKISTRIKIDEKDWNKKKSKPKFINATFQGRPIMKELERYEYALKDLDPFAIRKQSTVLLADTQIISNLFEDHDFNPIEDEVRLTPFSLVKTKLKLTKTFTKSKTQTSSYIYTLYSRRTNCAKTVLV